MKILFAMIICLTLPILSLGQEPSPEIPFMIRLLLDNKYPGWKFPEVDESVRSFLKERVSADARPEVITGDFDGNRMLDHAVLIKHGRERGKIISEKIHLVAFLQQRHGYMVFVLDSGGGPPEYLTLGQKGTQSYDHEAGKKFTYRNDAIEGWIFEKAGWAYVYDKGKFRYIYTLD